MDGSAFKAMLGDLGYSQAGFSRAYRIPIRTVENWVRRGPPEFVAHILQGVSRMAVPPPPLEVLTAARVGKTDATQALDPSLRSVFEQAVRAGWPRELIAAGAIDWFVNETLAKR